MPCAGFRSSLWQASRVMRQTRFFVFRVCRLLYSSSSSRASNHPSVFCCQHFIHCRDLLCWWWWWCCWNARDFQDLLDRANKLRDSIDGFEVIGGVQEQGKKVIEGNVRALQVCVASCITNTVFRVTYVTLMYGKIVLVSFSCLSYIRL